MGNKYDVVLITDFDCENPRLHQRALGAYTIAELLNNRSIKTKVIDYFFSFCTQEIELLAQKFITAQTKLIAISDTFIQFSQPAFSNSALNNKLDHFVLFAKQMNPEIKVLQGGAQSYYKYHLADYSLSGQNKEIDVLVSLKKHFPQLSQEYSFESEAFCFTDGHHILKKETLPIEVSRGCIFSCKFCGFFGRGRKKNTNFKNLDLIKDQLTKYHEQFTSENFYLCDDTFNESY